VMEMAFYVLVPLLLLVLAGKLLWPRSERKRAAASPSNISEFLPVHHREFPDVERRLAEYGEIGRKVRAERRAAALAYLDSLYQDFLRVERLLNRAAKFLPEVTMKGESERVRIGLNFRIGYWIARQQIIFGLDVGSRLKDLTQKIQTLSDWADTALDQVAREHGLPVLQSDLNR
jgi:hypothetical protein